MRWWAAVLVVGIYSGAAFGFGGSWNERHPERPGSHAVLAGLAWPIVLGIALERFAWESSH